MAKPRVFVSSTYYDLRHIRSSLELFIESLGFEPVLSEKGDIAFLPDAPLDESCYREAQNADILVLIVGGRYGSEASSEKKPPRRSFFDRYESITKKEYESAAGRQVPIYILLDTNVYAEYQTYLKNKERTDIEYAHVDSVNVFALIEQILSMRKNNPLHTFERFADIESWLREQWSGLFREMLQKQSQQQQLSALSEQVGELGEISETLRKYLEAVITAVEPESSEALIQSEAKRLEELERNRQIRDNPFYRYLEGGPFGFEHIVSAVRAAKSFPDFAKRLGATVRGGSAVASMLTTVEHTLRSSTARRDFNDLRRILGKPPLKAEPDVLRLDEEENGEADVDDKAG